MIYIYITLILFALELVYFRIADYFDIIDKPNERSSHYRITLRGGGIVFYFGALAFFTISGFQYEWFIAGLSLITIISFADDIRPQSPSLRLIIHFIAILLMFNDMGLYQLPWYYAVMGLILCVGILNAYNFMDGINGMTGAYSLAVLVSLYIINNLDVKFIDNQFIYIIGIAVLVFNFFNFRTKAKCFAGDVGAISIAFTLIFLIGTLIFVSGNFSYILLLVIYGVDSIMTIIHRLTLKENIFKPHRKHLYQLLANELQVSHLSVSLIYGALQLSLSILLSLFLRYSLIYGLCVVVLLTVTYWIFISKYFYLHVDNEKLR